MDNNRLDWYMKNILNSVNRLNDEENKFIRKLDEINKESVREEKTVKRKSNVFYLDLYRAYKEDYVVDRNEWLSKYDIPGKQYKMLKGTEPLLCIDGTCIYLKEVTDLIVGGIMERARYQRLVANNKPVFFKWKR